jgi:hypothetical protein
MHDFIWKFRLKAPPSLTMGTLFSIARVRFPNSNLHLNFLVHFIKEHFMFSGVNYSKKAAIPI